MIIKYLKAEGMMDAKCKPEFARKNTCEIEFREIKYFIFQGNDWPPPLHPPLVSLLIV